MSTYTIGSQPSSLKTGDIVNCPYSGTYKSITLKKGTYQFECWGARGGSKSGQGAGGYGGYVKGTIILSSSTTYYLFVGGVGTDSPSSIVDGSSGVGGAGGYAGGGSGGGSAGSGGGGCSAISSSSALSNTYMLMVAGGGGGSSSTTYDTNASARTYTTANTTSTYTGESGATGFIRCYYYDTFGGGGGYYGGASIAADDADYAYGGVNYIGSGFTSTASLDGTSVTSRPSSTNGYIRITVIKAGLPLYVKTASSTWTQINSAYRKTGTSTWTALTDSELATYFTTSKSYITK